MARERRVDARFGGRDFRAFLLVAVLSVLSVGLLAGAADGAEVVSVEGSAAGQTLEASGLAVDTSNGNLIVADTGNRRIDVFDASGEFIRAFGWGVVASGPDNDPVNEVEKVQVAATGGIFRLLFIQNSEVSAGTIKQETQPIPFDATAVEVQSALEALLPFEVGDVTVTGPGGGPWSVEFTGRYADTDVHELEEGPGSALTGGASKLDITTIQGGATFEVCEASVGDVCRAGQRGASKGQLNPFSVAVDPTTHDIYVFDGLETASFNELDNNRVQKFTSEGEFLYMLGGGVNLDTGENICTAASGDKCGRGVKGSGSGEFDTARSSVAVGPGSVLYVNDGGRVQKFSAAGAFLAQVSIPGVESRQLGISSSGDIYGVVNQQEVKRFDGSGNLLSAIPAVFATAIAITESDQLYLTSQESGRSGISLHESSGTLLKVFYGPTSGLAPQIAIASALGGGVFAVERGAVNFIPDPGPGPVVYPANGASFASLIGNVRATLKGEINPEGKAATYHFEVIEQADFEAEGWSSSAVVKTAESPSIGSDFTLHAVQSQIGCVDLQTEAAQCLVPSTKYRFRLVATNADGTDEGPDATFVTRDPVEIGGLWSTDVDTEEVLLHAEVNPVGFQSEGYFEVVTEDEFQINGFANPSKVPAEGLLNFGNGEAMVEQSAEDTGLSPGTSYRSRLVVQNNCKPAEPTFVCTSNSPVVMFSTFALSVADGNCSNSALRPGLGTLLPDCRGYEMVSPVDKGGSSIEVALTLTGYPANLTQGSANGEKITFSAYRAFGDPASAPFSSQYLAKRTASGWESQSISPPREGPMVSEPEAIDFQYKGFIADLCFGWVRQDTANPLLAPKAVPGYENIYRRDNCDSAEGGWEAVTTTALPKPSKPRDFAPELEGFSADGSKAVFSVVKNAIAGTKQAFETVGEEVKPVCILPNGKASTEGCVLGSGASNTGRERSLFNAVSADGSRIFWSANERLYVRINGSETLPVSEAIANEPAFFWGASDDGSKAIFTMGGKLYSYDVDSQSADTLAGGVEGVAGMSRDGARIYFVSEENLATGAEEGKSNLYLWDAGSTRLVTTLETLPLISPIALKPFRRNARVTPSGNQLVFMSPDSLTGYDNTDAASGEADHEVFVYDASADSGNGSLSCISCNPTGARPEGRKLDVSGFKDYEVAATIPIWSSPLSAPRVIADDGSRVFFNSYDRLVIDDRNQVGDVYQWERSGTGSCQESSPAYIPSASGCVTLISAGQIPLGSEVGDSEYVDSSSTGDDVFFRTYSSLAPQDPELIDIYDARVGGGTPASAPAEPDCEKTGSCQPQQSGAPPSISPSSIVPGPGNPPVRTNSKRCPKGKHKVKRKGKVVCVKNRRKHQQRRAGK